MAKASDLILTCIAGMAMGAAVILSLPHEEPITTYSLVYEAYTGDRFVIDYNLTIDDCAKELNRLNYPWQYVKCVKE